MPPNMVDSAADEKAWKRAKARAAKQGHAEDWPYVVGIFQKMTGKGTAKGMPGTPANFGAGMPRLDPTAGMGGASTWVMASAPLAKGTHKYLSKKMGPGGKWIYTYRGHEVPRDMHDKLKHLHDEGHIHDGSSRMQVRDAFNRAAVVARESASSHDEGEKAHRAWRTAGIALNTHVPRSAYEGTSKGPLGPMVDGLRKAITAMAPDYQRPSGMDAMVIIQGLRVHLEQMPGDVRHGKFLVMGYGEAPGTMAADGEPFDIYVGPNKNAELVYVIDQLDAEGELDEHKAMAGFDTAEDAARAYCGQMGENKMGGMVAMHAMDLAKFLANTDRVSAEPFADLAAEAGVPVIKVWMPMAGVGPLASPAVMQANGAV